MLRRIRARTLSYLLRSYLTQFPDEAAREAAECDSAEGGELLALLASDSAWLLLDRLEPKTAAGWLHQTSEPALRRLFARPAPEQTARLWAALNAQLRSRIIGLVDAATAARLEALADS